MHLGMTHMNIFGHHVCINLSGHHFCLNIFEHNVYMNIFGHNICLHEYIWKPCLHEYFWTPCRLGFLRNVIFLCYFTQKYFFPNFWASFAQKAEKHSRNILHCSASLATRFSHICAICAKIKIAKKNLRK